MHREEKFTDNLFSKGELFFKGRNNFEDPVLPR